MKEQTVEKKRSSRRRHHVGLIVLLILLLICGAGFGAYAVYANNQYSDKFIEGTMINGMNVGNMTVDQVEKTIKNRVEGYALTLSFGDGKTETLNKDAIGLSYESDGTVQKVLDNQNRLRWIEGKLFGTVKHYKAGETYKFDKTKLQNAVSSLPELQDSAMTKPVNASMKMNDDGTLTIVPETDGNYMKVDKIVSAVEEAVESGKNSLDVTKINDVYEKPAVTKDDANLNAQVNDMNTYLALSIQVKKYDGTTQTIDRNTIKNWLAQDENGNYYLNTDTLLAKSKEYIKSFAAADDDVKSTTSFQSQNQGVVQLSCSPYGHRIDQDKTAQALYNAILARQNTTVTPTYSLNSTSGGFGNTFVEIDIAHQMVYVHQNGQVVFSTACVTGTETDAERKTPRGVFKIFDHTTERDLKGPINPATGKPSYVSHVHYWMPFHNGVGMHDATWRSSFGGNIYMTSGSHGCVNLPLSAAQTIYGLVNVGTYVIVL